MTTRLMAVAGLVMVLGGTAKAQLVVHGEDRVVVKTKTDLVFGPTNLTGTHEGPTETLLVSRGPKTKFKSLITLRKDFTPELGKSVDNL